MRLTSLLALCALFTAFASPAMAANLPGHACASLGVTQKSDDDLSIVACLKTSATDAALVWKSMTPVHVDAATRVGVETTTPAAKLDVNGTASINGAATINGTTTVNGAVLTTGIMSQNLTAGSPILSLSTGGTNTGIGATTHQIFGPYDAASGTIGALYLGAGRKGSNYSSRNDIILYNLSCSPNTKNGTDWNCNVPNIYLNADATRASADLLVAGNTAVGGSVKVGQTAAACTPALAGAMRFNPGNASMEFCNGSTWGPVSSSGALQSYALVNEGTINLGVHSFCALSRVRSGGWGSATAWWCDIQQTSGGAWSLTAHFQRNADSMPGNADCRAICM